MADTFIHIRNVDKSFNGRPVLRQCTLDIERGKTLVVIGRSGGGKSVLLKNIIGLLRPDSGEIFVDGHDITQLSERQLGDIRKKVGILFQSAALFDSMSVEDNIAFPLREIGVTDSSEIEKRVADVLEVVDLAGEQKKMPESLSGGMKKRVGLARAIVSNPACILYDEPTTGLDPIVADSINRLIRHLQKRFSVTSIAVTHDMTSAYHIADQIAYLHEGRIYFQGTPAELQASTDPLVQDFIQGRSGETH
jgi:phospholipid/cholesterol/gamma-HCH transport system ATP-binding protein